MEEIFYPSHDGVTTIHACVWRPEGEVRGVVQIIHGMAEYAARYAPFAEYLNSHGFLVCAEDHLGHGLSVRDKNYLGYFDDGRGTDIVIADIRTLNVEMKMQNGGKPYFVLGHSMGSFICRKYISKYGSELNGAVIMGSGFKSAVTLGFARFFVGLNALFFGWQHRSRLIKGLAFGSYNKKFRPARTENDWLSRNTQNVDAYERDELCGFPFTNNGYAFLFGIIKEACSARVISAVPKTLPVYFVAGADDPVGDYGRGVKRAYEKFVKAGVKDVSISLYEGGRHEILNDDCKEEVMRDILNFFEHKI